MARTCRTNTYHHCNLRQTLIDNCLKLIEDKGVSGFTLREIARMSGVSPAAPYHHFKSKTELLAAVAVMGFEMLDEAQRQAIDDSDNAGCRLEALGKSYVMFAVNHKVYFHVMFRVNNELLWENPKVMNAAKQTFSHLENTIRELYPEAGEGNGSHLRAAVITCWSMVHGLASLWMDGPLRAMESGKLDIK
ncbi:MAG: TetR/AcrR family transcriptional regulator, partial [Candidatus Aegiribacteria sp.]|nr:TetR/AcrR family transcriptional regulator [Candidatus Aegiribacteria sp.]